MPATVEKIKLERGTDPPSFERDSGADWRLVKLWNLESATTTSFDDALVDALTAVPELEEQETRFLANAAPRVWCFNITGMESRVAEMRALHQSHAKRILVPFYHHDHCYFETISEKNETFERHRNKWARLTKTAALVRQILSDLEDMRKEEDEPDFRHRPTDDAYRLTQQIIKGAYTHYVASAPMPAIAPDGDGGVIVEWQSNRRIVRLVVPASKDESSYVYSRGDGPSKIDDPATDLILAQQLRSIFAS